MDKPEFFLFKGFSLFIALIHISLANSFAQSQAHDSSFFAIIDPAYYTKYDFFQPIILKENTQLSQIQFNINTIRGYICMQYKQSVYISN